MCVVSAEQQLASRGGAAGSVTQHDTLCGVVSFDGDDEESGARSSEAARCVSVGSSRAETACRRGTVWLGMKPSRVAGRPPHQRHASMNPSTGNDRCPHGHENLPSSSRPRIGPNVHRAISSRSTPQGWKHSARRNGHTGREVSHTPAIGRCGSGRRSAAQPSSGSTWRNCSHCISSASRIEPSRLGASVLTAQEGPAEQPPRHQAGGTPAGRLRSQPYRAGRPRVLASTTANVSHQRR